MDSFVEPPGHVFVTKGDTTHFACDVFLWATDKALRTGGGWQNAAVDVEDRLDPDIRREFQAEQRFTLPVRQHPNRVKEPVPVLTAVPFHGIQSADDIRPRVREFFKVAADLAHEAEYTYGLDGRPRPLIAVPLFGARGGGGAPLRGDIFRVLYDESLAAAFTLSIDVVIVLRWAQDYDLAQAIRRAHVHARQALSETQLEHARRLGAEATERRLVPFMGAGVSVSAGAPSWSELIEVLAEESGLDARRVEQLVQSHDVLDQAAYVHRRFALAYPDDPMAFPAAIIEAVDVPRYGLAPALLACLESEQAITLNYDTLFEDAADDAGLPRRVIPGESTDLERWLLKLHGSITDKKSIVLTRDDYLGFATDRNALSSLVKATLMTRRLLFVGFGVSDPHFHEIIHDVRRALPQRDGSFGTVLTLKNDVIRESLWEGDLDFIMLPSPRVHDIFLDALMAHAATTHSYLLADGYESTLPPSDAALREALRAFLQALPDDARKSGAWPLVENSLEELGSQATS